MEMRYDVIIIGSGPAGLTAAIYAQRAGITALVVEKNPVSGGQMLNTQEIDNYPGLPNVGGFELSRKMREHAEALGAEFLTAEVEAIEDSGKARHVVTDRDVYEARSLVLATGAGYRKLGVPGEEALSGVGVSYCATCDGAFFRNKTVVVVGGGDTAVEDACYLARGCEKVYLIHRRDSLRAAKSLQQKLFSLKNVEVLWNCQIKSIEGTDFVESVTVCFKDQENFNKIVTNGVFIAVGVSPNSKHFASLVELDDQGYVVADETCKTSAPGIFAAGDLRGKPLRQIVTAVADGANAIYAVEQYLRD